MIFKFEFFILLKVLNKAWLFGVAGGGYNEVERTRWAKQLAQRPLHGDFLWRFKIDLERFYTTKRSAAEINIVNR